MKKSILLLIGLVLVLVVALAACGENSDIDKIDINQDLLEKLPCNVEVTGLENVSWTASVQPVADTAKAEALDVVKDIYYVADGAAIYAVDIAITDNGKAVEVGKPVSVSIELKYHELPLDQYVVFHVHDGRAEEIIPTVSGDKLTITVSSFSPFLVVPKHIHTGEWKTVAGQAPTCTEKGQEMRVCACGKEETREVDALGHALTHNAAVTPDSCLEDGSIEYFTCSRCGKLYLEADCFSEITLEGTVVPAEGHVDSDKNNKCDRCGADMDEGGEDNLHQHVFGEWSTVKAATCTTEGVEQQVCTVEGCNEKQIRTIAALGHKMTAYVAVEATCTTAGNKPYYVCSKCGKCYLDESGKTETSLESIAIPASHSMNHHAALSPTCLATGNAEYYTCSVCGKYYADVAGTIETTLEAVTIAALAHCDANSDNKCDNCGADMDEGAEPTAYTKDGDYIYFGTYPQTQETDATITSALLTAAGTLPTAADSQNWTSYGYYYKKSNSTDFMWYIDLTYGADTYRGVYYTQYRSNETTSNNDGPQFKNGYTPSVVYWFKYEPIKWRIVAEEDGEALLLCETVIDSQDYFSSKGSDTFEHNGDTGYANNYALSNIRAWLNDTFYNTAFNALQKAVILQTTVDNSARSTFPTDNPESWGMGDNTNPCACRDTEDYIFLLSVKEVTDAAYGFSTCDAYDAARQKKPSDYAKSQGVEVSTYEKYAGNAYWWLRSPNDWYKYNVQIVQDEGSANHYVQNVTAIWIGVVPAVRIRLD